MKSQHTKVHSFAGHTSPNTGQSLQKSVLFSHPRRNSIYFSPALQCFIFFATAQQPTTDEHLDRTTQVTNRLQLDADEEARIGNRVDGLSDEVRGSVFITPQAWPTCVRELRSSPSKNGFPKSIFSRGHTRRFINLTVFVDPIQALRYTRGTPGICMIRIYSQLYEVLPLAFSLIQTIIIGGQYLPEYAAC